MPVQKITICDALGIKRADISNLVRDSLLVEGGEVNSNGSKWNRNADYMGVDSNVRIARSSVGDMEQSIINRIGSLGR